MDRGYHHGDLRAELLKAARKIVIEEGAEHVTMRRLSQCAGVSRTALYRHFPGKHALLCAVAEEGFRMLDEEMRLNSGSDTERAESRFERMANTYIHFALRNPEHYRLMFGREIISGPPTPGLREAAREAFENSAVLIDQFRIDNGIEGKNQITLTGIAWATVHGLATLLIDGQVLATDDNQGIHTLIADEGVQSPGDNQRLIRYAIRTLIAGMKNSE